MKKKSNTKDKGLKTKVQNKLKVQKKNSSIALRIRILLIIMIIVVVAGGIVSIVMSESVQNHSNLIMDYYVKLLNQQNDVTKSVAEVEAYTLRMPADGSEAFVVQLNLDKDVAEAKEKISLMTETCGKINDSRLSISYKAWSESAIDFIDTVHSLKTKINEYQVSQANYTCPEIKKVRIQLNETKAEFQKTLENCIVTERYNVDVAVRVTEFIEIISMIITFGVCLLVIFVVRFTVTKPLIKANNGVQKIVNEIEAGEGDLTVRLSSKYNDEVGQMIGAFNQFIETLQGVMKVLKKSTNNINKVSDDVKVNVESSKVSTDELLRVMEALIANMQEISSALEIMVVGAQEVKVTDEEMAVMAVDGEERINEIVQKADVINQDTIKQKNDTETMISNISKAIENAIDKTSSIQKIDELVQDILSISAQTNLLALNASIEAARAEESGKGFSVVADEIRELADATKVTVTDIKSVNQIITESVTELVKCTTDIKKYVSTNIMQGYDRFTDVSENYENDASLMNKILTEFNDRTMKLEKTIVKLTNGMTSISQSVNECTDGVESAAQNIDSLLKEIESISEEAIDNKEIADELQDNISRFKKVEDVQE